jgi:endonuclease/exonuclease/phosphatase (EEP) superfamily protein YafD
MFRSDPRRRSPVLSLAFGAVLAAAAVPAIAALSAGLARPLDTLGQFAEPALALAVLAAVSAAATGRRRLLIGFLVTALGLVFALAPQWFAPRPPAAPGVRPVRLYVLNLWRGNADATAITRSIQTTDADIVALIEVSDRNAAAVDRVLAAYPYRMQGPEALYWGGHVHEEVASRLPLKPIRAGFYPVEEVDRPSRTRWYLNAVAADIGGATPFRLILTHLGRPWPYRHQTLELDRLLPRVRDGDPDRTVVVGDFNATAASLALRRFAQESGLAPTAALFGDWPAFAPAPLRVAIENVLAGPALSVGGRRLAPRAGSDHLPIVVEIAPAAAVGGRP